jgi:hypothetical protein
METKIFDRETILDLIVNFIPLGIILFFIAAFLVYAPWGFDPMTSGLMLAIMVSMFVALSVLTYFSATAIAGDEKRATVYAQGQAGLEGAKPLHELEAESAGETTGDDAASSDPDDVDEAEDVDDAADESEDVDDETVDDETVDADDVEDDVGEDVEDDVSDDADETDAETADAEEADAVETEVGSEADEEDDETTA